MNDFNKNMEKVSKTAPIKNWFGRNGYKIVRVLLFPAWFYVIIRDKYRKVRREKMVYSDQQAKFLLDKYLPYHVKNWLEEDGSFLMFRYAGQYCGELDFYNFASKMKRKHASYFNKFITKIERYFIDQYEIDGYTKYSTVKDKEAFHKASGLPKYDNREAVFFQKGVDK